MQFKLAILTVLASRPDGRATFDELRHEVEPLAANDDPSDEVASVLDEVDIFQSGLVVPEDDGLRITDAGRSALHALETSNGASLDLPEPTPSPSLKMIDRLIGTEERLKIFDLEVRLDEIDGRAELSTVDDAAPTPAPQIVAIEPGPEPDFRTEEIWARPPHENGDAETIDEAAAIVPGSARAQSERALLTQDRAEVGIDAVGIPSSRPAPGFIRSGFQRALAIWRSHLERDTQSPMAGKPTRTVGGGAIALITLLVLVICAGAVIAFAQIKSLKSEVATLQRELLPLRERAARAEFLEKAKLIAEQQAQNKSATDANRSGPPPRTEQAAFNLTPEEIRLIRDFIKAAPGIGTPAAPAINVGDPVSIATIPLPSPLMEKIPKLLGARFTTRNGSIVILKRDSKQADIVLPPN